MTNNNTQLASIAPQPQPQPQPQPASAAVIEYDHAAALPIVGISDLYTAGDLIAKSGILGAKSPAEGFLVAAICHQERISFLRFGELYHLMNGKISIKAEALLARLLELGGTYKVLERTPDKVALTLKYKAAEYTSEFTWENAQKEDYTRDSKGKLKPTWSTPRGRMQMMWARAISDGVRVVCPLATRGTYTPEEVMDFDDDGGDTDSAPRQPRTVRMAAAGDVMPPIVPLVAEQAPVMQAPPAAAEPESPPSPFDDAPTAAAEPPPLVDYSVCRCVGTMQGRRWDSMDNRILELAAVTYHPDITDGDKAVIQQILAERQQQQAPPQR